jgi:hypothetical protein
MKDKQSPRQLIDSAIKQRADDLLGQRLANASSLRHPRPLGVRLPGDPVKASQSATGRGRPVFFRGAQVKPVVKPQAPAPVIKPK